MRRDVLVPAIAIVATLAACADDPTADPDTDDPVSAVIVTTTTSSTTPSATTAPTPTSAPLPSTAAATTTTTTTTLPRVGEPVVASELVFTARTPVDLAVRPGDDALYVVGQRGPIVRHEPGTGETTTVLDLGGRLAGGNEQGVLGLAFSPDGARAYVDVTDRSGATVIAEYAVDAGGVFDSASERELLRVEQPYGNHNAGDLEFGPDGILYVTLGDGGSSGDPGRRASDPTSLLGSLLRIDPTPSDGLPYTIPADNPFATGSFDGVEGAPEVWAWGLRNPWKIAFDPVNGDLWIADVGQNRFEEINRVTADENGLAGRGVDFGWSAFEGTERYNDDVDGEGATMPVVTYGREDGCSVSGGVPYRGTAIPELEPAYVYSDFCGGRIWALDLDGARVLTLLTGFDQVTAVRTGPDGEIYVLERGGGVHRLVAG